MRQVLAATRGPNRALTFGGIGLWLLGMVSFSLLSKSAPIAVVGTLSGLLSVLGFVGIGLGYATSKATTLELEGAALVVPKRGAVPLAGAVLGPYNALNGMRLGTALHLRGADGPLVVASIGHRADPALASAPGVGGADFFIEPDAFEAILARAGAPRTASEVLHLQLTPHSQLSFTMIAPFVFGMLAAVAAGTVLERAGWLKSQLGQSVFAVVVLLGIGAAVVRTIVKGTRGARGPRLELHAHVMRLIPERGAVLEVPRAALGVAAFSWTYTSRTGSLHCPGLSLSLPGQPPLTIGALSVATPFPGAPYARAPGYLVSDPDVRALAQALGVR